MRFALVCTRMSHIAASPYRSPGPEVSERRVPGRVGRNRSRMEWTGSSRSLFVEIPTVPIDFVTDDLSMASPVLKAGAYVPLKLECRDFAIPLTHPSRISRKNLHNSLSHHQLKIPKKFSVRALGNHALARNRGQVPAEAGQNRGCWRGMSDRRRSVPAARADAKALSRSFRSCRARIESAASAMAMGDLSGVLNSQIFPSARQMVCASGQAGEIRRSKIELAAAVLA